MISNPRGDKAADAGIDADWVRVLAHRQKEGQHVVETVIERFRDAGVRPSEVESHLCDGGDRLYSAARLHDERWADEFGGPRAVALLAAEVSALMSHLVARAASVRSVGVEALLDEFSAVTVASVIGVARQKVYELAKPEVDGDYVAHSPWRTE
ncbi:MAG: hypothetical protein IPK37_15115 [Austwickia sp.]|jgi:hypothetical protein|nr:MAG: hypothetical protein IPK37_15115 [Austwickia sp.]